MFRFTLTYQSSTVVATKDPVGWEEMAVQYIRSEKFWGIFYEITSELGFFCDSGGDMLRDGFNAEGSEADVLVLIEFQCADGDPYDVVMDGRAKMDTYRVERFGDSDIMYVSVENNDLNYKVLTRFDTPLDLKSLVGMDGQALTAYTAASVNIFRKLEITSALQNNLTGTYQGVGEISALSQNHISLFCPAVTPTQIDLQAVSELETQYLFELSPSINGWWISYYDLFNPLYTAETTDVQKWPSDLKMTFSVAGTWEDPNFFATRSGDVVFNIYRGVNLFTAFIAGPVYTQPITSFTSDNSISISANYSFSSNITFTPMQDGEKIWAFVYLFSYDISVGSGFPRDFDFNHDVTAWDFEFTSGNEYPETSADCLLIHEAFSRTLESISGQFIAFQSDLLGRKGSQPISYNNNGCHSFIAVTNGLNVRGKTEPIETSLGDLYDSVDSIGNVGLGIELRGSVNYVARLEEKSYFFDNNTLILTLNGVNEIDLTVWEDEIFNECEIGFPDWEPFAVTGLDEPLTIHNYQNRIKNIKNKLDLTCPAIMSMNVIEIVRRFGADQNITKDLSQDEKLIFIALNRSVGATGEPNNLTTQEKAENFSTSLNITTPATAINLRYSPARNLLRHMNRLAISLLKFPGSLWRYASGEGNVDMQTVQNADGCDGDYQANGLNTILTENQDTAWDDPAIRDTTPIFEPILYSFSYPLAYSDFKLIRVTPRGYIRLNCVNGNIIEGFVKEINYVLERGTADFILIKKYNG